MIVTICRNELFELLESGGLGALPSSFDWLSRNELREMVVAPSP